MCVGHIVSVVTSGDSRRGVTCKNCGKHVWHGSGLGQRCCRGVIQGRSLNWGFPTHGGELWPYPLGFVYVRSLRRALPKSQETAASAVYIEFVDMLALRGPLIYLAHL